MVTANKALLAHHGTALARAAEAKGVSLGYEAAVAGGIPIIKTLREGLAANRIERVYGILNGTCNYILTTMRQTGREFADVLADAQRLGYAEADPSFDVDGIDAAHKLAILAAACLRLRGRHRQRPCRGHPQCLRRRYRLCRGARLSHQAAGHRRALTDLASSSACMPAWCRWARPSPMSRASINAVVTEGDFVGRISARAAVPAPGPTASAVVSDLIDIARGRSQPTFGVPAGELKKLPASPMARHRGAYYIRLMVVDKPGVIADVTAALRDEEVSLESMLQRARSPGEAGAGGADHPRERKRRRCAARWTRIAALGSVVEPPHVIRIESL